MSRTLFAMWGVIVLALHVDASVRTPLIECDPKVNPMAGALPSCFTVNFDCYQLGLSGLMEEVEREWKRFDRNTVEKLQILHCPAMEMPIYIQKFQNLGEILVYNTTLVEWNANAALSGFHHPKLQSLSVARSNMTDGFLPPGLQSQEFPSTVFDICFAETNLRALSDDLDVKWPVCSIFIENSLLTAVPPSLLRLQLLTLSLSGNPIQTVPRELFEKGYTHDTRLSRTLVRELPQNVSFVLNYATQLVIMNTSISFFWSWIDPLAELALEISSSTIFAGGSTYCLDLEKILSGTASVFSEPFQPGHSTLLMNASEANWDILRQVVDCTTTTVADHSMSNLAYWDAKTTNARHGMDYPTLFSSASSYEYVTLSYCSFVFWWLVIFLIHFVTCAYNAGFAKFYWDYDASFLSYSLEVYAIGMPREDFLTIAYVHIALASAHGVCVLHLILCLLSQRTVSFTLESKALCKCFPKKNAGQVGQDRVDSIVSRSFTRVYMNLAHREGFFGVNGKHFHRIHIFREILETALQTIQAIRMSKYLPHPQLNHFYVGLLVVNCWSSVLIHSRWFWHGEAHRRFALVVCDCALDMMSTVGVSAMIALRYADQYNVALAGFNFDDLSDDNWVAQMLNEAQMVLVVSWSDMAMRVIFSLGIIMTTTNMKELLRRKPNRKNRLVPADGHNAHIQLSYEAHTLLSPLPENNDVNWNSRIQMQNPHAKKKVVCSPPRLTPSHGINLLFAFWGFVVLALHIYAITQIPLMECVPKVHPMAGVLPSCFVVDFNCHKLSISGQHDEVLTEWKKFDHRTAVKLIVLHCPAFEVPTSFSDFILLQEIRVYNTTIDNWGDDVAITNTYHPRLTMLSLVRTKMKDGILPVGLQSIDFPANLYYINFCETNLASVPDDIDAKWHVGSSVYVENSKLTAVPQALIRLQPFFLVLGGNSITEIPPELFEIYGMLYLILAHTNISELPRTISNPSMNTPFIDVRNTAVSYFWSWIDPLVEMMLEVSPMILASGSTYCNDLDRIRNGESATFTAPLQADSSSILMNSSEANWDRLIKAVDCSSPLYDTMFDLLGWDGMYRITV
ncbi:hypothetical protein L914_19531 [Phytophthora nicotianae]|uniref:Leucine-rich repeat domain, L domain-like n=1 Tax=Phytophthora nicotianae TaxID=4792 RepID=W2MC27_PHYNI|nr:hypothetical protein L914_19531 [Phytophthora nicotianae]